MLYTMNHIRVILNGPEDLELLGIVVNYNNKQLLLCLLYRPPATTAGIIFDIKSNIFENVDPSLFSNFVFLGDFNVDYLQAATTTECALANLLCSFHLTQVVHEPTHIAPNGSSSLIYWVLLSSPTQLGKCDTISPLGNSDHSGISLSIKW